MKNYDQLIQARVDRNLNIILGVTSSIAYLAALLLFIAEIPRIYWILNFSVGSLLLVFFLLAKKIDTKYKIIVIICVTGMISLASFMGGGFSSAFLTLLILMNVVAILFLEHKQSIMISLISLLLMCMLAYYAIVINKGKGLEQPFMTWGLQIISFVLLIILSHISIKAIKNYLIENIEELENSVEYSNRLAYYDQLTKLPNAYKFKLEVVEQIQKHKQDGFIFILNLKSLNLINSTLGQEYGDQALVEVTEVLNRIKVDRSIIARVGGNEFAIWIDDMSEEELYDQLIVIINELKKQSSILKKKLEFYAVSANFSYANDTFDKCYQRALLTLIYAKNNNILDLISYDDQIEASLRRRENIKDLIEEAMFNNEFTLYYQAKYDSRFNQVIGVEALARWHSKELGFVSPLEFIPIIESLNMASVFGDFVIQQACKDFKKLQEKYNDDICVSINISPSHIMDSNIVNILQEEMERYQVPVNKLFVEITEDIMIEGIQNVRPVFRDIKKIGIKISLDDFGTGYSSLNYLTQLELDEIKIDKSFIDQIHTNERILILLESIIILAKKFDLSIIAEGVESKDQKDILNTLGCYLIQGYYYAKPEALE